MKKDTILTAPDTLSLGQRVRHLFELMKGFELLGAREHPSDFNQIRAEYINTRIRLLALLFSILTPLWIPVDYLILPEETFLDIVLARLLFSASLLALWVRASYVHSLYKARRRLVVLMLIPAIFHLSTQFILGEYLESEYLASYTFLPILIIAIHCVFPLTLKEGILLAFFTIFALSMDELVRKQLFSLTSLNNMWLLGVIMSIAIWAQLSQLHMQLKLFEQATTDALTGLLNRRSFMSQVETELSRSERYNRPLSMALLDLDFFKHINDAYGHQAGDKILVHFSELLREELRATDIIGRFGGEEFIVALPETPLSEAERVIKRVLQSCRESIVEFDDQEIRFTSSAGLGEVLVDIQSSMKLVDAALYEAKDKGRDKVVLASGTELVE